jgi:hypothetical protein
MIVVTIKYSSRSELINTSVLINPEFLLKRGEERETSRYISYVRMRVKYNKNNSLKSHHPFVTFLELSDETEGFLHKNIFKRVSPMRNPVTGGVCPVQFSLSVNGKRARQSAFAWNIRNIRVLND